MAYMTILQPQVHDALEQGSLAYREFACDPSLADTAAFCEKYGFSPSESANAILVAGKADPKTYACCIVLATTRLDVNKAVVKQMGVKKASFASAEDTQALTGMMIGGVTPFGLSADIPIYIDAAVMGQSEVVMGGGNRSSKVVLDPRELTKLPNVTVVEDLAKPAI
jgi:prolyl-tRNA editing enzyme YbaK/EbsC (Cys-tRNA(Pro) deacylase)